MPPPRFQSKPKKKKVPEPVTAEEWFDKGVEDEENGERWRSGDKVKSGRWFHKALEAYETSLRLSPLRPNFDAAYNAAHIQYVLASSAAYHEDGLTRDEHLRLLKRAVECHIRAMALEDKMSEAEKKKCNWQDLFFNAGQCMTEYAEKLQGSSNRIRSSDRDEIVGALGEAVTLYQRVWEIQERRVQEQGSLESLQGNGEDDNSPIAGPSQPQQSPGSENGSDSATSEWAYEDEPVTLESLVDTAIATLEALIIRVQVIPQSDTPLEDLTSIRELSTNLLNTRIIPLATRAPHLSSKVLLVRARYATAQAEAAFRLSTISLAEYEQEILAHFSDTPLPDRPSSSGLDFKDIETLCEKADAHIAFAGIVVESNEVDHQLAWKHYNLASLSLTAAAGVNKYDPQVQLGRGDVELLRSKVNIPAAQKSVDLLRSNARVYYRNTKNLASPESEPGLVLEASVKEAMLAYESGDGSLIKAVGNGGRVKVVVAEAVSEGLFGMEWLQRFGIGG
ncbi:hypothetical protein BJ508DRAFT_414982 [Ascobolus immersus RN42]|uniref:TPR-like protein n=1 Tax=Ascobolus immersus RN42 TaxID=1160509 RepID=A0A3N4IHL0_ASCIM|nr:hypothetical protein BJ508DRAFT_414982 [Ascobolus immersus RN42]